MRVLIVGAGVSGLTALSVLVKAGFDAACVDAQDRVGGQWLQAYDGVVLQNSRDEYRYPGRPYPTSVSEYPSKEDVLKYWRDLVSDKELGGRIRLNTEVVSLRRLGEGWVARLRSADGHVGEEAFGRVVVATGLFGRKDIARPCDGFKGREMYSGSVERACDMAPDWMPGEGSSVAIVGFGATAAGLAAKYAQGVAGVRVRLVHRRKQWWAPRYILGVVPSHHVFFTRLTGIMTPAWFYATWVERWIHCGLFAWLVAAFFKMIEAVVMVSSRAPWDVWPRMALLKQMRSRGFILNPPGFFEAYREGRIRRSLATIQEATGSREVKLSNGEVIHADHIIYATGYRLDPAPFLDDAEAKETAAGLGWQLYRHVVHPDLPGVAFVGLAASLLTGPLEFCQACWIAEYFAGELKLPDREAMIASMRRTLEWKVENSPLEPFPGVSTVGRHYNCIDELLCDLGVDPGRKGNAIEWLFAKTTCDDYTSVWEEAVQARKHRRPLCS